MDTHKILVPYNFTGNDEKAIDLVVDSFGREKDAEITLFHTYIPVPAIEVSDKTVMARLSGNMSYLRQKKNELEKAIADAAQRLIHAGFNKEKVHYIFTPRHKETAQEIIDLAIHGEFTGIVLNHNPSKIRKFFTTSISKKVAKALMHKKLYIVG
jgi:nucleotide-binding universal stress UspA family protein